MLADAEFTGVVVRNAESNGIAPDLGEESFCEFLSSHPLTDRIGESALRQLQCPVGTSDYIGLAQLGKRKWCVEHSAKDFIEHVEGVAGERSAESTLL